MARTWGLVGGVFPSLQRGPGLRTRDDEAFGRGGIDRPSGSQPAPANATIVHTLVTAFWTDPIVSLDARHSSGVHARWQVSGWGSVSISNQDGTGSIPYNLRSSGS